MKYRSLGKSGIEASVVGFGAWAIGGWMWGGTKRNNPEGAIRAAVDHGINLIDTAPMYGYGRSEELVGDALKGLRDKVVLATKCGMVWYKKEGDKFFDSNDTGRAENEEDKKYEVYINLRPAMIRYEVEKSLRRLKTDRIDLYQTHWQDSTTKTEDVMAELEPKTGGQNSCDRLLQRDDRSHEALPGGRSAGFRPRAVFHASAPTRGRQPSVLSGE
jgi:methylglyoxal reductase